MDRRLIALRLTRQVHQTETAVDQAIIETTALVREMVESRSQANVAAEVGHDAIVEMIGGLNGLATVRGQVVRGHQQLATLAEQLNVPIRMDGPAVEKIRTKAVADAA